MIQVKIIETETDHEFRTELPKIPQKGDGVGCWINDEWVNCIVTSIIYEFDKDNKFLLVEIGVNGFF